MSLEDFAADALDWPAVRDEVRRYAPTAIGRRALDELAPRAEPGARAALARTGELLALDGQEPPLAGVTDPVPELADARRLGRSFDGEALASFAAFLRVVVDVEHWLAARRTEAPTCAALVADLPDVDSLRALLDAVVDERGRVHDDASPALARLRRRIGELTRRIEAVLKSLASSAGLRASLADGMAGKVQRRAGRRVLAVKAAHAGRVPGIVHERSQSGETLFVEPREVVEEANSLSAALADEARELGRVLAEATREVLAHEDVLFETTARFAELELAVLGARWARETAGRPALLPGERGAGEGLVLRAFRHPLLVAQHAAGELERLVPIDLRLGAEFDLLVVTGPNTGGKTLALKSAGLAALLTRLGLPLPADEGTTVPLFDGVAADIGDEQEVEQSLSTFSSHLARIRAGLERATPTTLFLLDELGGGTDPAEGAALGDALLEHLAERGVPTIASTHLGKLKEFAFRCARAENACVDFDVETLAPRYQLLVGTPGESRALAIARRLGLPEEILARAEGRVERSDDEALALMDDLRDARVDAERLRAKAEDRLTDVAASERELALERGAVEEQRARVESEAQRDLDERTAAARAELERGRKLLPQLGGAQREAFTEVLDALAGALDDAPLTERRAAFVASLKKGTWVWLPRWRKRCRIRRVHRDAEELVLELGKRELRVSFDEVSELEGA